jgi:glycosyltransferase involved in cell wall biosynthesis
MDSNRRSVALLNPFPSPYRLPILNALAQIPDIELIVYLTDMKGAPDHHWEEDTTSWQFQYRILPSIMFRYYTPRYGAAYFPINFTLPYELIRGKHDVIVTFGWTMLFSNLALLLGRLLGAKVILWEESIPHPASRLKKILEPIIRRLIGSYHWWFAASTGCKEYLASYNAVPENISIVPQVVDFDFFTESAERLSPKRSQLREQWELHGKHVICFVGQLIERKGINELLEAFYEVQQSAPDAILLIAGTGPLEGKIRTQVESYNLDEERVRMLGYLSQSELPELYAISDVFVLPSHYDAFGAVVLEAMASGLPVVVTEGVGAAKDLVVDGESGRVVPVGGVDQLARAIAEILADEKISAEFALAARVALQDWSIPKGVAAFEKAVKDM